MKARLCLVTSLLLLAAPAFAQEPLEKTGTEPSAQSAPSPGGAMTPEPMDKVGAEPSTQGAAPAASDTAPGKEPLEQIGTEPSESSKPAQQQAGMPEEVVITDLTEAQDGKKLVKPWNVPVDSVQQMDVFDGNGKKIGQVDAVLQDKNGDVKGVAVGYGGFLGFGEKGAIVTLDQVKLKDGALVTDINEDQLSKLPAWLKK
jgi:sporulation protein YlmC with PRC-barrel domain